MVLVNKLTWNNARSIFTLDGVSWVLEFGLHITRIYETNALDSHLCGSIGCNESWRGINDVRIIETELDIVVGVVKTIESDLDGQHIGLRVHWNLALDCAICHQLSWLIDSVVRRVSKSNLHVFARRILADEVGASDCHHLLILVLELSKGWINLDNMRRFIVGEAMSASWCLNIDPVLVVERDLNQCLGSDWLRHRNHVDLLIGIGCWVDQYGLCNNILAG